MGCIKVNYLELDTSSPMFRIVFSSQWILEEIKMWIKNFGILGLEITVNGSKVKKDAVEEVSNSWYCLVNFRRLDTYMIEE